MQITLKFANWLCSYTQMQEEENKHTYTPNLFVEAKPPHRKQEAKALKTVN